MIYVCWADVSALDGAAEDGLSEYRREKLKTIRNPEARRRSLGAELLLLRALGLRCPELPLPPRIICAEGGKPFLQGTDKSFNLSHSGDFAACALSDEEVGLDLQIPVETREGLVRRFLTRREREYLDAAADRDAAFTELWARKESFIKATGKGLAAGLDSFCAAPGSEGPECGGRRYAIRYELFPDFHLAVCYPADDNPEIKIERIELP